MCNDMHEAVDSGVGTEKIRSSRSTSSGTRKVGVDGAIRLDASRPACTVIGRLSGRGWYRVSGADMPRYKNTANGSDAVRKRHLLL